MASRLEMSVLRLEDGRDLAFAEYGDRSGRPVFFFHGTPGSCSHASLLDQAANESSVRLISPDRPGFGHSTFDPQRRLLGWPNDVVAIAGELELDRFGVIGLSGGGPHAAVCGRALGERLTGCEIVSGVGSIEEPDDADGMMVMNRMLTRLARRAPFLLHIPFRAMLLAGRKIPQEKLLAQMTSQLPPADVEIMTRPEVADELIGSLRAKHPTIAKASAQDFILFAQPWGFELEDISVPVHIWHGDADVNVPVSHGHRYDSLIERSTMHLGAGKGHLLIFDHAQEILATAAGL